MAASLPWPARLALVFAALVARCSAMMMNNREPDAGTHQDGMARASSRCVEAVLVEPRSMLAIKLALETAALVRDGPDGKLSIDRLTMVHGSKNRDYVLGLLNQSPTLKEALASGRLRLLPLDIDDLGSDDQEAPYAIGNSTSRTNHSHLGPIDQRHNLSEMGESEWVGQYSRLLFNPKFWKQLECDNILTMQSDTLLCLNSEVRLSEFLGYDFVGAVASGDPTVSNGGLSLRSRRAMLECAESGPPDVNMNEDIFFSRDCTHVKRKADDATRDRFAVDDSFRHPAVTPFGHHKPWGSGKFVSQNLDSCRDARALQDQQHP